MTADREARLRDVVPLLVPDPGMAAAYLRGDVGEDPCFGYGYDAGSDDCRRCCMAVDDGGTLRLCWELCRELTEGTPATERVARNLGSREVMARLSAGASADEILAEIAGAGADAPAVDAAREVLSRRFGYLRRKGVPVPDVPPA